jgi:hypothetical protein
LTREGLPNRRMDAFFVLLTAGFFTASWGLVRLCEKV